MSFCFGQFLYGEAFVLVSFNIRKFFCFFLSEGFAELVSFFCFGEL